MVMVNCFAGVSYLQMNKGGSFCGAASVGKLYTKILVLSTELTM